MAKRCPCCERTLSLEEFHKDKRTKDGHHCYCKRCSGEKARKWQLDHPERAKDLHRKGQQTHNANRRKNRHLKYGLTTDQYNEMLKQNDGCCWVCGGEPEGRWGRLFIDHDHKTGVVRGLLCNGCNRGLGFFNDDPALLEKAMRYLKGVC